MKKIKLILTIVMLFSFLTTTSIAHAADPIPIVDVGKVDPNSVKPLISVSSSTDIPVFNAGSTETLTLPIKNDSNSQAKNLIVSLEVENKQGFPFIIDKINLSKRVGTLDGHGTANVSFDVEVDQYAVEGTYAVKLNYSYSNIFGYDYTSTEQIMIKVVNKNKAPKLVVNKILTYPLKIMPGQNATVSLGINNLGTLVAKDVKVTLMGLRSDGFSLSNSTDVKYISLVEGQKEKTIDYSITASKSLGGGNYPLEVKMEYKDEKNNPFTETSQIFLPVIKEEELKVPVELTIENVESPDSKLLPGQDFTVSFDITNKGKEKASNIKAYISADKEVYPKSVNTVIIDSLDAGQSKRVSFSLSTIPNTSTKNYPIALNIEYDETLEDKPGRGIITQYVGAYVEAEEEDTTENKSIPRIIVSKYNLEPDQVNAGDTFKLALTFLNTNRLVNVKNIKISLVSDDGTFIPASSSSTFYIENISPQGSVENEILLNVKADAAPKSYMLGINFEYEDEKGNQYSTKESVSIPVNQLPRLVTGEVSYPMEIFVGQAMPVSIEFYNMGKSTLYNLMVTTEGDFQVMGSGYYVGNFEPGRSDYFDNTIMANAPGEVNGKIVFTFEDASGKDMKIEKEFSMNVIEMDMRDGFDGMGPDNMPMPDDMGKKPLSKGLIIGGSIALLAILMVVIIIIRKKIKTRKEMALDEEF
jgi:hypothetical protein